MLTMRAGLLRIALAAFACQLAGVPALAISSVPGPSDAGALMPCCRHAGPDHVCPMMHRRMGQSRDDEGTCALSACCPMAPAAMPALGLVILVPPTAPFVVAPGADVCAASDLPDPSPAGLVLPVPAPPPWA